MRLFVAAVPPQEVVEELEDFLEPRRDVTDSGWRWAMPSQWHLTLAFADPVPERSLDDLVERLTRGVGRRAPLSLALSGGGAFPNAAEAKILYAAVAGPTQTLTDLDHLAGTCRAAFATAGAPVDGGRFRPHVTVARRSRPAEATRWVRVLDTLRTPDWRLEEVALVRSHLSAGSRGRPRHEVLDVFALRH